MTPVKLSHARMRCAVEARAVAYPGIADHLSRIAEVQLPARPCAASSQGALVVEPPVAAPRIEAKRDRAVDGGLRHGGTVGKGEHGQHERPASQPSHGSSLCGVNCRASTFW